MLRGLARSRSRSPCWPRAAQALFFPFSIATVCLEGTGEGGTGTTTIARMYVLVCYGPTWHSIATSQPQGVAPAAAEKV